MASVAGRMATVAGRNKGMRSSSRQHVDRHGGHLLLLHPQHLQEGKLEEMAEWKCAPRMIRSEVAPSQRIARAAGRSKHTLKHTLD
jgi:hypothetical protein